MVLLVCSAIFLWPWESRKLLKLHILEFLVLSGIFMKFGDGKCSLKISNSWYLLKTPPRQENFKKWVRCLSSIQLFHRTPFQIDSHASKPPKVQAFIHPNQLSTVDIYDFTTILHIYVGF
jgi:hypothetical protein